MILSKMASSTSLMDSDVMDLALKKTQQKQTQNLPEQIKAPNK